MQIDNELVSPIKQIVDFSNIQHLHPQNVSNLSVNSNSNLFNSKLSNFMPMNSSSNTPNPGSSNFSSVNMSIPALGQ